MQTQTLIELLSLVIIAAVAAHPVARGNTFRSSIVSGRDHSVVFVYDYSPYRGFHAIRTSSSNISHLHEILVPSWSEKAENILLLMLQFQLQFFITQVHEPHPHELQTFLKLFIMGGLVELHELSYRFFTVFSARFLEEILISSLEGSIYQHNIEVIAFFEFEEDILMEDRGQENCSRGFSKPLEAGFSNKLLEGLGLRLVLHFRFEDLTPVILMQKFCNFANAGIGQPNQYDS